MAATTPTTPSRANHPPILHDTLSPVQRDMQKLLDTFEATLEDEAALPQACFGDPAFAVFFDEAEAGHEACIALAMQVQDHPPRDPLDHAVQGLAGLAQKVFFASDPHEVRALLDSGILQLWPFQVAGTSPSELRAAALIDRTLALTHRLVDEAMAERAASYAEAPAPG
ncbi:hypothetical protein [Pseudoroseicyclus aestuarii]|uniref:Uncharacterized protein n=1 Tax=Pseudoroseicyclus aestuarii TaxID=1795041 RepID=A0A318SNM1_9RHOB|nr:hypothetical protein [Pseudoroseicyclus aestuarii]PYE82205.1 hypothetical protein DFP88_10545 [Pseudoroseicyclus aestuarii]